MRDHQAVHRFHWRWIVPLVLWTTVLWIVVFWGIGSFSLLDPDEAHYAELTREMLRTHRWLVPLFDGAPLIDKPVLFHWLQTLAVTLAGDNEIALRLPSACASVALIGVVRWIGAQLFGSSAGTRAALMFATLPLTFVLSSVAVFDMLFAAFLFSAFGYLLVAALRHRPKLEYVGWPLLTLAIMTKGPVALILVLIVGVVFAVRPATRAVVNRLQWRAGLGLAVLAATPWFLYMWVTYGDQFVRDYMFAGNVWYFTAPLSFSARQSDPLFYARTFIAAFFPWSFVALGRGMDLWMAPRHEPLRLEERMLWTWVVVLLAFFSAARFKLDTYIFPTAPAVALLAAHGWRRPDENARSAPRPAWTLRAVFLVAVVLIAGGVLSSLVLFRIDLELPPAALIFPLCLAVGGIALAVRLRIDRGTVPHSLAVVMVTLLCAYASVIVFGLPVLERSRPTAPIGRWLRRHAPEGSPIGVVGLGDWHSSIRYYADRPLVRLDTAQDVERFLDQHRDTYVLMLRRDYQALRAEGTPIRAVGGRRAIVGRSGKYIRRQVWGRIVVARRSRFDGSLLASIDDDVDLPDP